MTDTMVSCVELSVESGVAVVTIDRPPVNAIDREVRAGLIRAVREAEADDRVKAIVLTCSGRTFIAGADLGELETGIQNPPYREMLDALEDCSKPVVAGLFGTALGGGVEVAMACHYRVATADARLGMPEVHMAIVPGAGGTQRLPRLVGAKAALTFLLAGAPVTASEALGMGLIDDIVAEARGGAIAFAQSLIASGAGPRPTGARRVDTAGFDEQTVREMVSQAEKSLPGRSTPRDLAELIKIASETTLNEGLASEQRISDASLKADAAQSLIRLFFAEREAARIPGLPAGVRPQPIRNAAVVGAGTMGSGIAMSLADAGVPTVLVEASAENLERGLKNIRANYEASAKRGRLTSDQVEQRVGLIRGVVDMKEAAASDVVIEAVFEDMDVKKQVLAQLDAVLQPAGIIASNTSSLSLTELASVTKRPAQVVGLHFFVPANVMKLLEIVRGDETAPETIVAALEIAKTLRKIGVVSGDGFGFIGNRMMLDGYWRETELMMLEGVRPDRIDAVAEAFGFVMGPMRVNDMAGVDIGTKVRVELFKREQRAAPYCVISDELTRLGRNGQKAGKGVYRYEPGDRRNHYDPEIEPIIKRLAVEYGVAPYESSDAEIEERLILSLINVGAQILEEGIAYRSSDIDVVWTSGYGFPRWRGGPMTYADILGLDHVHARMLHYQERLGDYWRPAKLLTDLANKGSSFRAWDKEQR